MPVFSLDEGESFEAVSFDDLDETVVSILDGDEARLTEGETPAPETGPRAYPGQSFRVDPAGDRSTVLHAVGGALEFAVESLGYNPDTPDDQQTVVVEGGGRAWSRRPVDETNVNETWDEELSVVTPSSGADETTGTVTIDSPRVIDSVFAAYRNGDTPNDDKNVAMQIDDDSGGVYVAHPTQLPISGLNVVVQGEISVTVFNDSANDITLSLGYRYREAQR